ncbi:MAG: thiamine pyrophosphate-requiring protein [Sumerlaeia bacterium]
MAQNVSEYMMKRMLQWGVTRIYGYPGDGINGLTIAMEQSVKDGHLEFVQARHEEMAAFMACAHAKYTGEVGVCLATSGPGAVHLLNGLYDAKKDHQPVVAIVGQQARFSLGTDYQQEIDLQTLYKDVASEFVQTLMHPAQARSLVDRAFRIAKDQRTVTAIIVPNDIQDEDFSEAPRKHGCSYTGVGHHIPLTVPAREELVRAAQVLNEGKKVAMLVGAGAQGAADEVIELADKLGAGIAKAWLGKAVIPDEIPFVTGSIGLLGTKPSWTLMKDCDTLLMIGTSFPYAEFLPEEGQARCVQIDIDGRRLSMRYPAEVPLNGDAKETVRALLPLIDRKEDRSWQEKLMGQIDHWWKSIESIAGLDANPLNPAAIYWELNKQLPDDVIIACDTGTASNWYGRDLRLRKGMMASGSGNLATMGPGVPYAIAAKFCFPDRPILALVGDGAMQMCGNSELVTLAKYWKQWDDPRFVILVLNNRDLSQVSWEQRVMEGHPRVDTTQVIPDISYSKYAELLGFKGIYLDNKDDIAGAWHEAFHADRPTLIEAFVDPDVQTIPPHIKFEQVKSFASALLQGDSRQKGIVMQSVKAMWEGITPQG